MRHFTKYIILAVMSCVTLSSCIYKYEAEGSEGGGVVVIEGDIVIGSQTDITISESLPRNSDDLVKSLTASQVVVECEDGVIYPCTLHKEFNPIYYEGIKNVYSVNTENLDPSKKYRLVVDLQRMKDGKLSDRTYSTDFLDVYITPPIDSVNYVVENRKLVTIMVNTHSNDPLIKNFKWSYMEDWEVRAHFYAMYYYDPDSNNVFKMDKFSEQNTYYCWQKDYSSKIIIGNSDNLSQNLISGQRLTQIVNTDNRISYLYAIEVYQQAISDASYKYWENVYKNNEEIGGIFSPQPNDMRGNIYCVDDPAENVLGYIDVGTIQKKRMWIDGYKLGIFDRGKHICEERVENRKNMWKTFYIRGYRIESYDEMTGDYTWSLAGCVDCRLTATKNRPDYFPVY